MLHKVCVVMHGSLFTNTTHVLCKYRLYRKNYRIIVIKTSHRTKVKTILCLHSLRAGSNKDANNQQCNWNLKPWERQRAACNSERAQGRGHIPGEHLEQKEQLKVFYKRRRWNNDCRYRKKECDVSLTSSYTLIGEAYSRSLSLSPVNHRDTKRSQTSMYEKVGGPCDAEFYLRQCQQVWLILYHVSMLHILINITAYRFL